MELTQLRHFASAAEHENLSRAARALGQSVSALSRSLKRLESIVNGRLFERTGQGLRLSERGKTLLEYAHRILAEHDHAVMAMSATGQSRTGTLKIGVVRYLADFGLPVAVAALLRRHPKAGVEVLDDNYEELIQRLINGELDIVVAAQTSELVLTELVFEPVVKSDLIYAAGASHPLAHKQTVSAADLRQARIIMSNRPAMIRNHYRRYTEAGEQLDQHPFIISSPNLIRQLLMTGQFVAISSRHAVAADLKAGRIVALRRQFRPDGLPVGLLLRKKGVRSNLLTAFMAEIRKALREVGTSRSGHAA
jgi:DNA-binding transcriptional LysR family regulator